jgi:predicted NodU family carbamoyl transferase
MDGDTVVAAVEEERLSRVKHSNLFPGPAAQACLREAGAEIDDVDRIAYFWSERWLDASLGEALRRPPAKWLTARRLLAERLTQTFRAEVAPDRLDFWQHHRTHAVAALRHSGFDESLVLVADGNGEAESTSIYYGYGDELKLLRSHPIADSLGHFYTLATKMVGYRFFDEYKVMGLAPYGDPSRYRGALESLTELAPDGRFRLAAGEMRARLHEAGFVPRHPEEPFTQSHRDFAAAVQQHLETVMGHVLAYWCGQTRCESLCLAGGVAQNSSMNGGILRSGRFRRVFVHPASHDAGAAMGAAMLSSTAAAPAKPLRHVFLGPRLRDETDVVAKWSEFVEWERSSDVCSDAADLLAGGAVLGWARGRSEFGPRALGNRSILADPRPADNKDRVNKMVKEREGYRPFAPAVLEEYARKYFVLPNAECALDFMGCVLQVSPDLVPQLGAVTHVDGTARVQVVRRSANEPFWRLLEEFRLRTGIPVLLNTSFNNHAEPIVQTAEDCLIAFLTTGLDQLVLGNLVIRKRPIDKARILGMRFALPPLIEAVETRGAGTGTRFHLMPRDRFYRPRPISEAAYRHIAARTGAVRDDVADGAADRGLADELWRLWQDRLVQVHPLGRSGGSATR